MPKSKHSAVRRVAAAAGIAAAVAAVAGAYFLYGPQGAKNRKKVKGWALKARGEVLEQLEKMKEVTEKGYREAVDAVLARYAKFNAVDKKELAALGVELKRHWKRISADVSRKKKHG